MRRVTGSGGTLKTVQVRAYSTPCDDGVRASMQLWVNGVKVKTWLNVAATWTVYQKSLTLSGDDQLEVVYPDDCSAGGYDRNLYVDQVVVDGQVVQAEGGAAVVDWGSGAAAFDGQEVVAGQEALTENGALRLVVGAGAYAACYDGNGNMTCRLRDGVAYLQGWDAENRLVSVSNLATGQGATYVYDGDGRLVKGVVNGVATYYAGEGYEQQGAAWTAYYSAGGERLAVRKVGYGSGNGLCWLLRDQLGSTALTVDGAGAKVAELRYKAYGETRYS